MSRILSLLLTVILLFLPSLIGPGPASPCPDHPPAAGGPATGDCPPDTASEPSSSGWRQCLPSLIPLAVNAVVVIWILEAYR